MNITGDSVINWLGSTLLSGVVISGYFRFIYDKQIEKIKHENQTEIEKYKSDLTKDVEFLKHQNLQSHDLIKMVLSHSQSGHQYSQERRLKAIEELWSYATQFRQSISPILNVYSTLLPTQYHIIYSNSELYPIHDVTPKLKIVSEVDKSLNDFRPFISEVLWASKVSYSGFLNLLYIYFIGGYHKREIPIWYELPPIVRLLKIAIKELPDTSNPFSIIQIVDELERNLLNEMNAIISGARASDASIEQSRRIIKIFQQQDGDILNLKK